MTDDDARTWTERALSTFSTRNREFFLGVADGSGWPIDRVGMLDQMMEYVFYRSKLHSFAGCTTIMSWGGHSADGGTYTGRNMDWNPTFNEFAQVIIGGSPEVVAVDRLLATLLSALIAFGGIAVAYLIVRRQGASN